MGGVGPSRAYFGVITDSKFRSSEMTEQARQEFFESGRWHVNYVMQIIRRKVDANFEPKRVLDFGCGVGRLLIPFAGIAKQVFGLDVSQSMLQEARRNCEVNGVTNVHFLHSDDTLSSLSGGFDLIHSCIVFQHIPVERGRLIFARLLHHLRPGGVGAVQFTYSKARFAATHGIAPVELSPVSVAEPGDSNESLQHEYDSIHVAREPRGSVLRRLHGSWWRAWRVLVLSEAVRRHCLIV